MALSCLVLLYGFLLSYFWRISTVFLKFWHYFAKSSLISCMTWSFCCTSNSFMWRRCLVTCNYDSTSIDTLDVSILSSATSPLNMYCLALTYNSSISFRATVFYYNLWESCCFYRRSVDDPYNASTRLRFSISITRFFSLVSCSIYLWWVYVSFFNCSDG